MISLDQFKPHLINLPGWRTHRKIVVFESDDWGSVRMASKEAYERLRKKGYPVDSCIYNRNDALECDDDVSALAEVLCSVKDSLGRPAIFTLNNIVANPDFGRIRASNFQAYFFEPFTATLDRYWQSNKVMDLYRQGIAEGIFQPQFHGREHVNVNRWLAKLHQRNQALIDAFGERMFTLTMGSGPAGRRDLLDSFGMAYDREYESMSSIIKSGCDLFEKIWGFRAKSFIAPCYVWPPDIEPMLKEAGIVYLQGTHVQRVPRGGPELKVSKKFHWLGQRNAWSQRYLLRNATFEPAEQADADVVNMTLKEISRAFAYRKPAIISSHRVNYIGSLRPENRDRNLKALTQLLTNIVRLYPAVEFMSSDQLGALIDAGETCAA